MLYCKQREVWGKLTLCANHLIVVYLHPREEFRTKGILDSPITSRGNELTIQSYDSVILDGIVLACIENSNQPADGGIGFRRLPGTTSSNGTTLNTDSVNNKVLPDLTTLPLIQHLVSRTLPLRIAIPSCGLSLKSSACRSCSRACSRKLCLFRMRR